VKTALIAGVTGLIGSQLLELLLHDSDYDKVIALSRNPLDVQHSKLINLVINFNELQEQLKSVSANDVFCCLGTTMKKARTKEAFHKVDFDYCLTLAKVLKENGAKQFLLVSALGADVHSSFYYNQVKGEIEGAVDALNYQAYHIFRPSLLLGPRKEQRSAEDAAKVFYRYFNFLIPEKYKGIESIKVARAMIAFAKQQQSGKFIHESKDLQRF